MNLCDRLAVFGCDGRDDKNKVNASARAVERSAKMLGIKGLLCSNLAPSIRLENTEWIQIEPITNINQYSRWILREPINYIQTEHALFCQDDAFVINPQLWNDRWLDFDYIGSPWPHTGAWVAANKGVRVGNGGFSLRSRRLLEITSKWTIIDLADCINEPEDNIICIHKRKELESQGIKFAPPELAVRFSIENLLDDQNIFAYPSFGFHGKANHITQSFCNIY